MLLCLRRFLSHSLWILLLTKTRAEVRGRTCTAILWLLECPAEWRKAMAENWWNTVLTDLLSKWQKNLALHTLVPVDFSLLLKFGSCWLLRAEPVEFSRTCMLIRVQVKEEAVYLVMLMTFLLPLLAFSSWMWLDCIARTSLGMLLEEECLCHWIPTLHMGVMTQRIAIPGSSVYKDIIIDNII